MPTVESLSNFVENHLYNNVIHLLYDTVVYKCIRYAYLSFSIDIIVLFFIKKYDIFI